MIHVHTPDYRKAGYADNDPRRNSHMGGAIPLASDNLDPYGFKDEKALELIPLPREVRIGDRITGGSIVVEVSEDRFIALARCGARCVVMHADYGHLWRFDEEEPTTHRNPMWRNCQYPVGHWKGKPIPCNRGHSVPAEMTEREGYTPLCSTHDASPQLGPAGGYWPDPRD
jgi:hypothetical protein